MKKQEVHRILAEDKKRKNTIISYFCAIFLLSVFVICLLFIYLNKTKTYTIEYEENSNLDYKVYLKENDFYEDSYLKKDMSYIASLIDSIRADFRYNLSVAEENVHYTYSYSIEALLEVMDTTNKRVLYQNKENLVDTKTFDTSSKGIQINESLRIDYNYYNDLIKSFVRIYDLEDVSSTLTIHMYVSVLGDCEDSVSNDNRDSVITLTIPLTTKTVAIDIGSDSVSNDTHFIACQQNHLLSPFIFLAFLLFLIIDICVIIKLILYTIQSRTAQNIYDKELKKILNNYKSYIQKIDNDFPMEKYQVLKVNTFTDMLEIRDTIASPILMVENKKKNGVYFCITGNNKILYVYGLKVQDIKKKMKSE